MYTDFIGYTNRLPRDTLANCSLLCRNNLTKFVTSAKQHQYPCSGPLTDLTIVRKCNCTILQL